MTTNHDNIRGRLSALQAEIEGLLAAGRADAAPQLLDQQSVGRLSRIDALQHQEMAKAQMAARRRELGRIAAALARLDAGDYGFCAECGDAIAGKRLDIDPMAERCVSCAGR